MKFLFEIDTTIEAPASLLWKIITDTEQWPKWGPSVKAVQCEDRFIYSKSSGYVQTVFGLWLPFKVTDFIPNYKWDWQVGNIQATSHRVEQVSENRSKIIFGLPAIAGPYGLICKLAANRIKRIAETSGYSEP